MDSVEKLIDDLMVAMSELDKGQLAEAKGLLEHRTLGVIAKTETSAEMAKDVALELDRAKEQMGYFIRTLASMQQRTIDDKQYISVDLLLSFIRRHDYVESFSHDIDMLARRCGLCRFDEPLSDHWKWSLDEMFTSDGFMVWDVTRRRHVAC